MGKENLKQKKLTCCAVFLWLVVFSLGYCTLYLASVAQKDYISLAEYQRLSQEIVEQSIKTDITVKNCEVTSDCYQQK
ncbi:MAG: hypothetical protein MR482_03455 [Selenomonadales bacterium]|nr:hypothetical protein [Selenomonadales bacterium]